MSAEVQTLTEDLSWWWMHESKIGNSPESAYILFEYFAVGEVKYAKVRVTCCFAQNTWELTLTANEVAAENTMSGPLYVLEEIQKVVEGPSLTAISFHLREGQEPIVGIQLDNQKLLELKLTKTVGFMDFLDRVTPHLSKIESSEKEEEDKLARLVAKEKELQNKFKMMLTKQQTADRDMLTGVRILMQSKLDHFKNC